MQSLALVRMTKINSKINPTNTKNPKYNNILPTYILSTYLLILPTTYLDMHTNVILTNKRRTHA